ncbi:hypothetical protein M2243_000002 [Heliophilum fasciatum]|nr:hypothetical protein [Heliophilum fasciatum]
MADSREHPLSAGHSSLTQITVQFSMSKPQKILLFRQDFLWLPYRKLKPPNCYSTMQIGRFFVQAAFSGQNARKAVLYFYCKDIEEFKLFLSKCLIV